MNRDSLQRGRRPITSASWGITIASWFCVVLSNCKSKQEYALNTVTMPASTRSALDKPFARYAMAVVLVSASFLLQFALIRYLGVQLPPFIVCYPAIMLVALLAGLGPGLLATALGGTGVDYFFMSPVRGFAVSNPAQAFALGLFFAMGAFMSLFAERYRRSQLLITSHREERAIREGKEELRKASEYRQLALDAAGMGLWEIRKNTGETTRDVNCRKLCGILPDEPFPDDEFWKLIHPDDRATAAGTMKLAMAGAEGVLWGMEYRVVWPDSSVHWIASYSQAFANGEGTVDRLVGVSMDITERKRVEAALRKSEIEHRLLFEQIPDGIFVSDAQGRFLDVNPAGVELMGYAPDELPSLTIAEILPAEESERLPYVLGRFAAGAVVNVEMRHKRKDGSIFDSTVTGRQLSDGRLLVIVRDITDQKHAEQDKKKLLDAVQKERDSLSALINAMKDEVWFIDAEERVALVNPAALNIFGSRYKPNIHIAELGAGIEFTQADGGLRPIENSPPLRAIHGEVIRNEEEALRFVATGEVRHREVNAAPIRDAAGTIVGALVVVHDITRRKHAEDELRQSEMLYRNLFSSMHEGFCRIEVIFDPENKPVDFRFIEVNEAFASQSGLHDVVGKRIREISPTLEEYWYDLYGKVVLTGEPLFVSDAEGLNRDFDVRAYRVGEPAKRQVAVVFNDISGRKKAETHIRQLNRVYSVLSDINQTIVREKHSQAMLEAACRIAVEKGEFRMAWIGMIDPATSQLNRVASSGFVNGYLDRVVIDLLDPNHVGGPVEHCVRSGKHAICNDIEHELLRPWKSHALQNGYRSVAAFPLRDEGKVLGVFTLYASEVSFFNESETRLLDELAVDISFGLEVNRNEEDRKKKEEELSQLNRVYNILSDLNRAIIREKDSTVMLKAACRIAVERGSFRMAWVGMIDNATRLVKPVATCGNVDGYLDHVKIELLDGSLTEGPAARCIRSGEHVICNDVDRDPLFLPWRGEALRREYRSCASLPLTVDGRVVGVFSLYAGEAGFFKGDELALLDQMAMDISFALEVNRREEDRKKTEENLRWQTAFFKAQVDSAFDGILVVDPTGKKILQNQRLNDLFKIPPSVANDRDDTPQLDFVTGMMKDPRLFIEKVNYLASHPQEVSRDQIELVDGSIFERYSYPVRDKALNYYGRIWTFRDITERRRLEEQFRQSQKMEAIGKLTGGIAHDFNNLLAVIIGNLDLLERQISDNEAAVKRVNTARNASLRGASLTRRLLAFARQESLHPTALDLNTIIQAVLALAAPALGPAIQIITQLDPMIPHVFADVSGLENALLNLFVNARDAMEKGGKLTITSELRTLVAGEFLGKANDLNPGCYAFVTVSDTGHGMTREVSQKVFEPFFTTKSHGTGLGLAMVYGFFKQSGGTVYIYSEPGSGTTLSFFLPIAEGTAKTPSAPALETHVPDVATGTILIVDDEIDVLEVASACLSELGYTVLTATNGSNAIQVLEERDDIDVLLTDILMPGGMNGVELAHRAIAIHSTIRVIYCSGFPADALRERNLSLAEGLLLRKPYQRSELTAIVRGVLAASISSRED